MKTLTNVNHMHERIITEKIQNATGYVWACMQAYTQTVLTCSRHKGGSRLCCGTTDAQQDGSESSLKGLKYIPFNKAGDNLPLFSTY